MKTVDIQFNVRTDTPNKNGVIYPKEVMSKAIREYNESSGSKFVTKTYGLKHHREGLQLSDVCGQIKEISESGDGWIAKIEFFPDIAKEVVEAIQKNPEGYRMCTYGIGTVDNDKQVTTLEVEYVAVLPKDECA